jgi:hypothetical protein
MFMSTITYEKNHIHLKSPGISLFFNQDIEPRPVDLGL